MPKRFDKFTERFRKTLTVAHQQALRLGHPEVTPIHLVLGLVAVEDGLGSRVIQNLGADLGKLRSAAEELLPPGQREALTPYDVRLSPETKRVIEQAVEHARRLNHSYIGQEHLLLGLLSAEKNDASVAQLFGRFAINIQLAYAEVLQLLSQSRPPEIKRYNLALPEDLYREVEQLANREHTTVLEIIRRSVKLGLIAARTQAAGGSLVLREGDKEREIVLL